ncbi:MAG TPA: tRNA pseudouridine(54/55) synthase Pus10 [Archaeoglobus profundus]|nr:tRNA pseudouridine(54/55) synthase Pus10 [Archaeoglobus profundus]
MIKLCTKCQNILNIKANVVEPHLCMYCSGILWKIDEIVDEISKKLKDYEFKTLMVGSRVYGSLKAFENYLGVDKSLKERFNRELGKRLALKLKKRLAFKDPDVVVIYDLENLDFTIQIRPVYVYGRYKKRVRGISQTRWLCSKCNGKGCETCNWTGKKYQTSVEELIAKPMLEIFKGENAILHGSGREDVDARMLGNGRPFIMEIQNPKKRFVDLKEVEKLVNEYTRGKVIIFDLKYAKPKDIEYLKNAGFKKVYRAKVEFEKEVSLEDLKRAVELIKNRTILQRTPTRVLHRRADLVRERKTYDIRILLYKGKIAVLEIEADSGLYIKELISGDEGRTKPSLSEALGVNARVAKLDVIRVEGGL